MKIKERRIIQFCKLQQFCIDGSLYTKGCEEDFENLLNLCEQEPTNEILYKIATDIKEHSEGGELSVEYLMFLIFQKCCTTFFDIT